MSRLKLSHNHNLFALKVSCYYANYFQNFRRPCLPPDQHADMLLEYVCIHVPATGMLTENHLDLRVTVERWESALHTSNAITPNSQYHGLRGRVAQSFSGH